MDRGYRKSFRTKNHHKSKGLDFQIEHPTSWTAREGDRPNIIQSFTDRSGLVMTSISTRDVTAGGGLTRKELAAIKTLKGSKALASEIITPSGLAEIKKGSGLDNISSIRSKRVVIDGWPGVMLEFEGEFQRVDTKMKMYNRMYIAVFKNYLLTLHCTVAQLPSESGATFAKRISESTPVFHRMANSIVIQSQHSLH